MAQTKIKGRISAVFVIGGISKEKKRPYLQVSDGIEAQFFNFAKDSSLTADDFKDLERGDQIDLEVEVDPFSKRVTVLGFDKA